MPETREKRVFTDYRPGNRVRYAGITPDSPHSHMADWRGTILEIRPASQPGRLGHAIVRWNEGLDSKGQPFSEEMGMEFFEIALVIQSGDLPAARERGAIEEWFDA